MSQVVDTKVVEMQFDGSKFEKNIEVCLNSLKRFSQTVDGFGRNRDSLDGLAKASDQIGISFDNMNMKSKISLNLFDMLAGVGTKAFNKISDAVAGFALNMANSLSGMQAMRDGFNEYELKMGSVQTILNGAKIIDPASGKEVTDMSKRLEVVNQKLQDLNEYSDRTIYSFKDMTSNIGKFTNNGVELDDAVKAIQGVANVAAISGANAGEASRAMYNFSQALSTGSVKLIDWKSIENANMATQDFKKQLIDTAVVMGTLVKTEEGYESTTTDLQGKISDVFTSTKGFNDSLSHQWMTSEVLTQTLKNYSNDVRTMTKDQKDAYREQLIGIGYTEEQADGIIKLGIKAADAATEVKTFSQMIDTLKESLGSGWAQSFETIFGDFEESKKLWTELNNAIDGILSPIGKARNAILETWKADGGRDAMINSFKNLYHAVFNLLSPVKALWEAFTPNTNHTGKILATIFKAIEKLTGAVSKAAEIIGKAIAFVLKPVIFLGNFVGKGLVKFVGIIRAAFSSVVNFFKPIGTAISTFSKAFSEAFDKKITSRVKAFHTSLKETFENIKKQVGSNATIKKLVDAFNSLRTVLEDLFGRLQRQASIFATNLVAYLGRIWRALKPILSSTIGTFVKILSEVLLPKLERALGWVVKRLSSFADALKSINIKDTKFYKGISELPEKIASIAENKTLKSIFTSIKDFGSEAVTYLSDRFKDLKANLEAIKMPNGLQDVFNKIKDFIGSIFGKDSIENNLADALNKTAESTKESADFGSAKKLTTFQKFLEGLSKAFEWLKNAASRAKTAVENFIKFIIKNTPKAIKSVHDFLAGDDGVLTLNDVSDVIYEVSDAFSRLLESMGFLAFSKGFSGFADALGGFTETLNNFFKQAANKERMSAIKEFAIALGVLVGALYLLSKIPTESLIGAMSALGIVGLGLIKFFEQISSMNFTAASIGGNLSLSALFISIGAAMIGVALSIGILVGALALFPKVIKQYNKLGEEFRTGMDRVKEVLSEIFAYLDHSLSGKYALRSAVALYVLVATLSKMRNTIINFAKEETGDAMEMGLFRIKQILVMLGDFLQSVTLLNFSGINIGINFNTLGIAAMIWALGDLLAKIVPTIQKAGAIPLTTVENGMNVIEKILWRLGIFLTAMNAGSLFKIVGGGTKLSEWIGISLTLGLITYAIGSIVDNVKTLTELASGDMASGFDDAIDTIQGIFIGLTVLMAIIGLCKPAGSGVLFALAVSISLITICIMALVPVAHEDLNSLLSAVGAIGVLMVALGFSLFLAGKAAGEATIKDIIMLIAMTGAMVTLAGAIRRIAKTGGSPGGIIAAAAAMGVAALSLAGAMFILGKIKAIPPSVLLGLGLLTAALWALAFAIKWFKQSSGDMVSASDNVSSASAEMADSVKTNTEHMAAYAADAAPSIISELGKSIGDGLKEVLGNFDLSTTIRNVISTVKEDAKNWAQDFIDIGTNLIDGISVALENPANIEKIKGSMKALGKALLDAFKTFLGINSPSTVMIEQGGYIIDGLLQGLMDYPSKLAEWVTGIGKYILDGVGGFFTGALDKGKELVQNLGTGIQNGKDFVVKKASELGRAALKKVDKAKEWGKSAVKSANRFGSKLQSSKNPLKRAAGKMIVGATNVVSGTAKNFRSAASTATSTFSSKIRSGSGPARAAGAAVLAGAKAAFHGISASFRTFGRNAAQGFRNGINSLVSSVARKAREMVKAAKDAAKSEQNSSSPSKDFMEYGGWAAEGYAIGLTNRRSSSLVEKNARKMVDTAKNAASAGSFGAGSLYLDSNPALNSLALAMSQISDTMDSDINSSPTIRPVIDMSNVNHGASAISALFGDRQLKANLEATTQIQNGFEKAMASRNAALSMRSIDKLANRIDAIAESMNSRSLNVYNTIDGTADPEDFANRLVRSFQLNARTI